MVPSDRAGAVLALDMATSSAMRTVAPLASGALLSRGGGSGFAAVCCTAGALLSCALLVELLSSNPKNRDNKVD